MSEVLDLKDALERVQDDKELLLELYDIFAEDFVSKRETINEAFKSGNVSEFQMVAHSLKGATGNISAKQMHETCVALDRLGKDGSLTAAEPLLEVLDKQFVALKEEIIKVKAQFAK